MKANRQRFEYTLDLTEELCTDTLLHVYLQTGSEWYAYIVWTMNAHTHTLKTINTRTWHAHTRMYTHTYAQHSAYNVI